MKKIYLIGFMGSGKTTIARYLSKEIQQDYMDLDEAIVKNIGKEIRDIFEEEGETAFRQYETETLKKIKNHPIISTGGGIVEKEENRQYMKATGVVFYLNVSFDVIQQRIANDGTRPLWKDVNKAEALFHKRKPLYEGCADYVIDVDQLSIDEVGKKIVEICTYKGILKRVSYY